VFVRSNCMSPRALFKLMVGLVLLTQWTIIFAPDEAKAASQALAVAMIIDLQGAADADVQQKSSLGITATLPVGARVRLDSGAKLSLLYLESGVQFVLSGPALFEIRPNEPDILKGSPAHKVARPLDGKPIRIDPSKVAQPALVLRSSPPMKLLGPWGTVVAGQPLEFRWQPLTAGTLYAFELSDNTGKKIYETRVREPNVKLPDTEMLTYGADYSWGVSARSAHGIEISRREVFRVVSAELQAELTALRPASDAPLSERITYATWLDQAGLREEARKYWRNASAERPTDDMLRVLAIE
jgi:hypothetical protein